jgi:hypothetical protein
MKKLDKSQSKEYGPLEIWAGDLTELFSELENCKNIEFTADDVSYDSIAEFLQETNGRNSTIVKISAREPYLTIELHKMWARFYISSSQLLASGLFHKIDAILSRCERKPKFFYKAWCLWLSVMILPNIFFIPILMPYYYLKIYVIAFVIIWIIYGAYIHFLHFSTIHSIRKEDSPSFFRRNIDGIIIAVISAVLGALVGVITPKLFDKIWPNNSTPVLVDSQKNSHSITSTPK